MELLQWREPQGCILEMSPGLGTSYRRINEQNRLMLILLSFSGVRTKDVVTAFATTLTLATQTGGKSQTDLSHSQFLLISC